MKFRKCMTALLCLTLLAGALGGCQKKSSGNDSLPEPEKGAYRETEVPLPDSVADWTVRQVFSVENEVHLMATKNEDGKTVFSEWSNGDGEFSNVTPDWLSSLSLLSGDWLETRLMQTADGTQYLFAGYVSEGEENYKSHLYKGEGGEARDITPEKWQAPNEWEIYERVQGIAALDNGALVSLSFTSLDIFSGEDGSLLESREPSAYYDDSLVTDGEFLYLCSEDPSGILIEKRQGGKDEGMTSLVFPQSSSSGISLCAQPDGTLIAAGADGIFRCQSEGTDWKKLLDASDTDFSLSDCWCLGMTALEDGRFYGLFQTSEGSVKLNKYEFDPEAVTEVKETLTLYSISESSLLRQAAALYHREHPEVLINLQYTYPAYYYEEIDYEAIYQELNTLMTGDNAPDLLVLDDLNTDTYAEKGLLEDLDDVVRPLEENGALLSGITGSYVEEDGKRYAVPLQFGFCAAVGRDIPAQDMASLKSLAAYLGAQSDSSMGPQTTAELVDKFYPYFCRDIVDGKELDREALGQNLEYLKSVADNCGLLPARDPAERGSNVWDLATTARLAFEEVRGFNDAMFPIAIVNYVLGDFTSFENSFLPTCQIGICTKSSYTETAKDFLRFALSEAVQDTDHYSGFPVNAASLDKQAGEDRSQMSAETTITTNNGEEPFEIGAYSKEMADKLVSLCKSLDHPVEKDAKIREVLIETLDAYLNGSQSKEDTIRKIEDSLKMYLAE